MFKVPVSFERPVEVVSQGALDRNRGTLQHFYKSFTGLGNCQIVVPSNATWQLNSAVMILVTGAVVGSRYPRITITRDTHIIYQMVMGEDTENGVYTNVFGPWESFDDPTNLLHGKRYWHYRPIYRDVLIGGDLIDFEIINQNALDTFDVDLIYNEVLK